MLEVAPFTLPGWRNWQTRRTQNPVLAREWEFDPPSGHHNVSSTSLVIHSPFLVELVKTMVSANPSSRASFRTDRLSRLPGEIPEFGNTILIGINPVSNPGALAVSPIGTGGDSTYPWSMHNEHTMRCKKCQGTLRVETAIDLLTGLVIELYVCFNCGRRSERAKPRPMTTAA